MISNPYQQYRNTEVNTSSPGKLVILLYEGLIKFINEGKKLMEEGNIKDSHEILLKAEGIVSALAGSLNMEVGGEISKNLYSLYQFVNLRIVEANSYKDPSKLEEAAQVIEPMMEMWKQIVDKEEGTLSSQQNSSNLKSNQNNKKNKYKQSNNDSPEESRGKVSINL